MVIACPACGGVYRFRRETDGSGTRVSCPDCRIEFMMVPSLLEATGERSVITLPDPGVSVTPDGERISAPMEVPLDDDLSDEEVLSDSAVGEFGASRSPTDPPALARIRRLEQVLTPGGVRPPHVDEHPSIEPDAELIRLRNNQGVDPTTLARRLLEEERMIPQERFVPVGRQISPGRWMFAGAAFMAVLGVCGAIGAVAGGAAARPVRTEAHQLQGVIGQKPPVSAVVIASAQIVEEEEEEALAVEELAVVQRSVRGESAPAVEAPSGGEPAPAREPPEILMSR